MKVPKDRKNVYVFRLQQEKKQIVNLRTDLQHKESIYGKLTKQVSWTIMIILNIAFLSSVLLEIIFSFEMYLDIGSRGVSEFVSPYFVALLLITLVVVLAAFAAHKLRLIWCRDLIQAEETLYIENSYSSEEAIQEVKNNAIRGLKIGLIITTIILSLVYFISMERVLLLSAIDETIEFSNIEILLPVILVAFEVLAGTHASITIKLLSLKRSIKKLKQALEKAEHHEYWLLKAIEACDELIVKENKTEIPI